MSDTHAHKSDISLPAVDDDAFDDGGGSARLIQGVVLKCVDGRWSDREGVSYPIGTRMLAIGTTRALQCWREGLPIDTITTRPLPDVDELNALIPKDEWEEGLNGPRPPWVLQHVVYLLDPRDGGTYTFINSTTGAAIATERLSSRVRSMRLLRGERVSPVVALDARPMQTKFGEKMRPEFSIVEWRDLGSGESLAAEPAPQSLPAPEAAKPEAVKPEASKAKAPKAAKVRKPGKPVKPTSPADELDDEIPF